jgi:hypothetical protein
MGERFDQRFVGVQQVGVLANHGDGDRAIGVLHRMEISCQRVQIGAGAP